MRLFSVFMISFLFAGAFVSTGKSNDSTEESNPYCVTWTTPGGDYYGSVPLGNGEIGVNAWVDKAGNLKFFVGRTDSFDEWGRLLKIGEIHINVPAADGNSISDYTQTLDTTTGCLSVSYKLGTVERSFLIWVDANSPIVAVAVKSSETKPLEVTYNRWRHTPKNIYMGQTSDLPYKKTVTIAPDVLLAASQLKPNQIGWVHDNGETTPDFDLVAKTQGTDTFGFPNPLKNRVFGVVISGQDALRNTIKGQDVLAFAPAKSQRVTIAVETRWPSTVEQWLAQTQSTLEKFQRATYAKRLAETQLWWQTFQARSWIRITPSSNVPKTETAPGLRQNNPLWSRNDLPLRIGVDSNGASPFRGTIKSLKVTALPDNTVIYTKENVPFEPISGSEKWAFPHGGTIDVAFSLDASHNGYRRLIDKIPVGAGNGFLVDITPNRNVRIIDLDGTTVSQQTVPINQPENLKASFDEFGRVGVTLNGVELKPNRENYVNQSDAFIVTQAYAMQRFLNACGGRGNYAIKFNGSIFTVPPKDEPDYADYRRWGPGFWWQNTRAVYYGMYASGDFDLQQPMFKQYRDILPFCQKRVEKYFGKGGNSAYYPECIYFWGDVFPETYGTRPWNQRDGDPLQDSRWHKWEWVGGLELSYMALNYYFYTGDETFLIETAIPLAEATTKFFDEYYKTDETTGKLAMTPAQAVETWWECVNPMPEIAGLRAVLNQLLALDDQFSLPQQRAYWKQLLDKTPELPTWVDDQGRKRFAPAEKFASKSNVENPELYCVFPFRLVSFETPDAQWAINALDNRWNKGPFCWRQDEMFMAYLGLANEARENLVSRAKKKGDQRFGWFWDRNYDWIPDQDHGGILMAALQAMLLQYDGDKVYLLPSWPKDWNVEFKLHAPKKTTITGSYIDGKITNLHVEPSSRAKDVQMSPGL